MRMRRFSVHWLRFIVFFFIDIMLFLQVKQWQFRSHHRMGYERNDSVQNIRMGFDSKIMTNWFNTVGYNNDRPTFDANHFPGKQSSNLMLLDEIDPEQATATTMTTTKRTW